MILTESKKLYDTEGNWIGMYQTALMTPEEIEYYNPKEETDEDNSTDSLHTDVQEQES